MFGDTAPLFSDQSNSLETAFFGLNAIFREFTSIGRYETVTFEICEYLTRGNNVAGFGDIKHSELLHLCFTLGKVEIMSFVATM
jgi:hypothetical protein